MFNKKARLLIVDDMPTVCTVVAEIFEQVGFSNTSTVHTAAEAWNIISTAQPPVDILISDWDMPQGTGFDLLKRIRADSKVKDLPLLMMALEAEKDQVFALDAAPYTQTILKPFSTIILNEKLESLYNKVFS